MGRSTEFFSVARAERGPGWYEKLKDEYVTCGVKDMAARWGFHPVTVWTNLRALHITDKSLKGHVRWRRKVLERIRREGGLHSLVERFHSRGEMAVVAGCSPTTMSQILRAEGYVFNRRKMRWELREENR